MTRKPLSFRARLESLEGRDLPSFLTPVNYAVGAQRAVAVGDFNHDGHSDIVTTAVGDQGGSNYTLLLASANKKGQSLGQFQVAQHGTIGNFAEALAVGDLNGDGNLDLIATNFPQLESQPGSVVVLLGNGDGTFRGDTPGQGFPYSTLVGIRPTSVAVGDFNGDGRLDVVIAGPSNSAGQFGGTDILLGSGDGRFAVQQVGPAGNDVHVADLNGDGKLDVVEAGAEAVGVSVLRGNGDGTFQVGQASNTGAEVESVAVGDFTGDGKPDLVTTGLSASGISVLVNNGDGTFRAGPSAAGSGSLAVGDFNRDGKLDIVAAGQSTYVLSGNGDGTFGVAQNVGPGGSAVAVGDFNGDGFPDLALVGDYGVDVLLKAGLGAKHK
jgi:hypothetical protein